MWFIVVTINGLMMMSVTPFTSEEGCHLAQNTAHIGECQYVDPQTPEASE